MRSGAGEVWICDRDGSNQRQVTFLDDSLSMSPQWSPDGREIAFTSAREGNWDVYVVGASGGVPRRLTNGPSRELAQSWSRDDRWVYFHSNRSGRFEIWKVPSTGGDAVQVTTRGATNGRESPDGRFFYYGKALLGDDRPGIWRIPREGGEEVKILDRAGSPWWTLLGRDILHVNDSSSPPSLELVNLARGEVSWAVALAVPVAAPIISVSPDGRSVLYIGADRLEADVMLVEGFR